MRLRNRQYEIKFRTVSIKFQSNFIQRIIFLHCVIDYTISFIDFYFNYTIFQIFSIIHYERKIAV